MALTHSDAPPAQSHWVRVAHFVVPLSLINISSLFILARRSHYVSESPSNRGRGPDVRGLLSFHISSHRRLCWIDLDLITGQRSEGVDFIYSFIMWPP